MGKIIILQNHYGDKIFLDAFEVAAVNSRSKPLDVVIITLKSGKEIPAHGFSIDTVIEAIKRAHDEFNEEVGYLKKKWEAAI